jgi:predicted nucleic acid-binding protein
MTATYLDSCMVIGLIEGDAEQRNALKGYLATLETVFSSELVRLEARILALRQNQSNYLQLYDAFFSACEFVDLGRDVFDLAASLRVASALKTPDALHLAAAITAGCDEFCTNDKQLLKVATQRIKVIDWEMLLTTSNP